MENIDIKKEIEECYKASCDLSSVGTLLNAKVNNELFNSLLEKMLESIQALTERVRFVTQQTDVEFNKYVLEVLQESESLLNAITIQNVYDSEYEKVNMVNVLLVSVSIITDILFSYYQIILTDNLHSKYILINVDVNVCDKDNVISFKPELHIPNDLTNANIVYCSSLNLFNTKIYSYYVLPIKHNPDLYELDRDWLLLRYQFLILIQMYLSLPAFDLVDKDEHVKMVNIVNKELEIYKVERAQYDKI